MYATRFRAAIILIFTISSDDECRGVHVVVFVVVVVAAAAFDHSAAYFRVCCIDVIDLIV